MLFWGRPACRSGGACGAWQFPRRSEAAVGDIGLLRSEAGLLMSEAVSHIDRDLGQSLR